MPFRFSVPCLPAVAPESFNPLSCDARRRGGVPVRTRQSVIANRTVSFLRAIEKKIRRAILNRSGGAGRIGPDDPLPAPIPDAPRILLLRLDRIGDAIISTPALLALRRRFPSGRIDVLLGAKNRTVAPLLPAADNVYVLPKRITEGLPLLLRLRRSTWLKRLACCL